MSNITLYTAPGTCGRVSCIALEEANLDFETTVVRFMKGEHKSPAYKAVNPKGKVPALFIDGQSLTENVAILNYLNNRNPEAKLLPKVESDLDRAQQLADLCFCSATLHPLVTRIRMPILFADESAAKGVWERGCAAMDEYFTLIDGRLSKGDWWYGDDWSAMDAYLYWIFWRCEGADYDVSRFENFKRHSNQMEERTSTQRALKREAELQAQLESEGLSFTPPKVR